MRNLEAEARFLNRIFTVAGAIFILGFMALAIGSEILVLQFWPDNPSEFWIWQGVWALVQGFVISTIASIIKKQQSE
jgi:hypothetical protein